MSAVEVGADRLGRLAALLSTHPAELVAAARLAAGRELDQVLDSPTRLRSLVLPLFLAERGPVTAVEPVVGPSADPAEVTRRIEGLPRLDRAVLVLLESERLTRAEAAGLVDRPVGVVEHAYGRALARLEADPYVRAAALQSLTWSTPGPGEIRRAERALVARRRTRARRRGLIGAAVLAVVGAVAVPPLVAQSRPGPVWVRQVGEWVLAFELTPPAGWAVESRTVRADVELTTLSSSGPGHCQLVVDQRPYAGGATGDRSVRVDGRPGRSSSGVDTAQLSWALAPGVTVAISCAEQPGAADLVRDLADRMVFVAQPISLPYRLGALPAHFHVDQVIVGRAAQVTVELWPDELAQASPPVSVRYFVDPPTPTGADFGPTGGDDTASCREQSGIFFCATVAAPGALDSPSEQQRTSRRLRAIVAASTLAASGSDESTWVDAREGLPRS